MKRAIVVVLLLLTTVSAQQRLASREKLSWSGGSDSTPIVALGVNGQWYAGGILSKPITEHQAVWMVRLYDALNRTDIEKEINQSPTRLAILFAQQRPVTIVEVAEGLVVEFPNLHVLVAAGEDGSIRLDYSTERNRRLRRQAQRRERELREAADWANATNGGMLHWWENVELTAVRPPHERLCDAPDGVDERRMLGKRQ